MDNLNYPYGGAPVNSLTQPLLGDFRKAFSDANWRRSVEQRLADLTRRVALLEAASAADQCISPDHTPGPTQNTWGGDFCSQLARTWG